MLVSDVLVSDVPVAGASVLSVSTAAIALSMAESFSDCSSVAVAADVVICSFKLAMLCAAALTVSVCTSPSTLAEAV